jgi:hypothetical protein
MRRAEVYEEERLLLRVQEAIAEGMERGGMRRVDLARALGVTSGRITAILGGPGGLNLRTVAHALHAAGFRLEVRIERLPRTGAP